MWGIEEGKIIEQLAAVWTLDRAICLGILCSLSIVDIRFRRVPAEILLMANIAAVVYQIWQYPGEWKLAAGGAVVGIIFLGISRLSREGVGYGDSWAILVLGIYLGLWGVLVVLTGAFLLLAVVSMVCLMRKRFSRRYSVPFFPFLAAGYLAGIWTGGIR